MTSLLAISLLGLLLGMRHATDADHVIAVSTIVTKQKGIVRAGVIGMIWGLGHTFTIFVVGAAIILFKVAIPARLGLAMELAVGLMLILLGLLNLTGFLQSLMRLILPVSSDAVSSMDSDKMMKRSAADARVNDPAVPPRTPSIALFHLVRPLAVGIVHGLAGSAAIALLVMTTIANPWSEIAYLVIFGLGTVVGMMLITALIAVPLAYTSGKLSGWNRGMTVASGLLSLGFGVFLSYRIGIMDGLFSAHPNWIPQ
jgi:high-affinity nickel permease